MMRRALATCAVLALALAVPVLSPAQPGQGGQLGIQARPDTITFGQSTTISGKLRGRDNENVATVLQENPHPYTGGFQNVATTTTDSNGDYSFRVAPNRNTRYRVVAQRTPAETSDEVFVQVRIRVSIRLSDSTPRRGALVRFSGSAAPEHDGRLARIQRRTSTGDFRTVARTALRDAGDERSTYSRRLRVRRDGVYRVLVPADGDHATGTSRARTIRVH
jgi:hypothetical protein